MSTLKIGDCTTLFGKFKHAFDGALIGTSIAKNTVLVVLVLGVSTDHIRDDVRERLDAVLRAQQAPPPPPTPPPATAPTDEHLHALYSAAVVATSRVTCSMTSLQAAGLHAVWADGARAERARCIAELKLRAAQADERAALAAETGNTGGAQVASEERAAFEMAADALGRGEG